MSLRKIIEKRKSVREYKGKGLPEELIKEIIDAARLAPSTCNTQPTRYFLVKDKEIKNKLKEVEIFKQDFVYKAPVIIVCCGDPEAYPHSGKLEPGYDEPYEVRVIKDIAIAAQNFEDYYSFDLRNIEERAIFLIYSGRVDIKAKKTDIDQEALLQIPIKIEAKN